MAATGAVEINGFSLDNARRYFLLLMRIGFGIWLLYAGVMKWVGGIAAFIEQIQVMFEKSWPPAPLVTLLAWVIAIAEVVLALLILIGWKPRLVWTLTAALMFTLMMGLCILVMPNAVDNWQFIVLASVCAALSGPSTSRRTS